jgi:streptogramin lyase
VSQGVRNPWGTATDAAGNIWFAEPGCDFAPTCPANTPTGQIGEIKASSHAIVLYTLPNIAGNQPIFLTFDGAGKLWFTTPNNDMIGEFDPSSRLFVGQWAVTPGSGPWDLTIAGGKIWYTEHLVSAVGAFNPSTHAYQDFPTPTASSFPYGIAANGGLIWFTENNSAVDQVAVLDTAHSNAISEYPIVAPKTGTPHLIAIDSSGHPWWTEGWANTIATLDPAAAIPGQCGTASGTCTGVKRFQLPQSACSTGTHVSGIAIQGSANLVWLDNSLSGQVGSFSPSTATFALNTLSDCGVHPHDGLILDTAGNVWFDEELANAIGELIPGAPVTVAPQGTWVNQVGTSGYLLGGWDGAQDISTLPNVTASLTHGGRTLWASNTNDVRALQAPDGGSLRNAAAYIDPNRVSVKLSFTNGYTGNISLYALDWDNQGRRETISVDDGAGAATVPLNTSFASGAWATFSVNVSAGGTVTINATSTAGPSAVLSAVMVGGAGRPPSSAPPSSAPPPSAPPTTPAGGQGLPSNAGGSGAGATSPSTGAKSRGVTTGGASGIGTATVGHVRVAGTVARVPVKCGRAARARCKLTLVLTARAMSRRAKKTTVAVGIRSVTLTDGSSTTVSVSLNQTGRRLLGSRRILRARLAIIQTTWAGKGNMVSKRTITFKQTRRTTKS